MDLRLSYPWTLVVPMAGRGKRFAEAGYAAPKPLIPVHGVPMFIRVLKNMPQADLTVLMVLANHADAVTSACEAHGVDLQSTKIISLPEVTGGAACTVFEAMKHLPVNNPLVVANADQWLDWSPEHFSRFCSSTQADGVVPVFRASGPKWSYAAIGDDGTITQIVEKVQISRDATCGVYAYRQAWIAAAAIDRMVKRGATVNGEYYLAPAYNEMIVDGARVLAYPVPRMFGMGTPEDLRAATDAAPFEPTDYELPMRA